MKIGILGGTFSPIHQGHLHMAEAAKKELSLDEVWFMPCGTPPHRGDELVLGRFHRFLMCEAAVKDHPGLSVCYEEYDDVTASYSYLTMEKLFAHFKEHQFVFLMGQDSLLYFDQWRHPERIVKTADIGVFVRLSPADGYNETSAETLCNAKMKELLASIGGNYAIIPFMPIDISSTEIRKYLAKESHRSLSDEWLGKMLPKDVLSYILERDLYQTMEGSGNGRQDETMDFEAIEKTLKKRLKSSRYRHTIGVSQTAAALAMHYGANIKKCRLAGLLHDCAKYMSDNELMEFCVSHDIDITEGEHNAPQLLHSKVGAYLAEKEYGISDKDILHAIAVHTTGCPEMNLYDKIIFTADYIEPNRFTAVRLDEIRNLAFTDLDLAICMILQDTIDYIESKGGYLDQSTRKTYEYYRSQIPSANTKYERYGIGYGRT